MSPCLRRKRNNLFLGSVRRDAGERGDRFGSEALKDTASPRSRLGLLLEFDDVFSGWLVCEECGHFLGVIHRQFRLIGLEH